MDTIIRNNHTKKRHQHVQNKENLVEQSAEQASVDDAVAKLKKITSLARMQKAKMLRSEVSIYPY